LAVADGSFIREEYADVCSAAFIIECTSGRGRIIGSFPEQSTAACAYRGELLGLMAIHLLLLAANRLSPGLSGSVMIHSDCFGALEKVATLPENRIPTRCRHSDTLKNIMVMCGELTFRRTYQHVRAHQDDHAAYATLSRPSQLNCIVDLHAKREIWDLDGESAPAQEAFPLEPVSVFVGSEKMTSDTSESLRFWVHLQLARDTFFQLGVMSAHSFDEVAWRHVYDTLHEVPRLFQLWACKQVMEVAGTNLQQSHYTEGHDPHCPSCAHALETCSHVLHCEEAGRVDALAAAISRLDTWLQQEHTDPILRSCLVDYARGRGSLTMEEITWCHGAAFRRLGRSQDKIGWRRFMEGMISREAVSLQEASVANVGGATATAKWARGLVTKLLETTHGQWLYRNVHVHDTMSGTHATARKEEIKKFIEDQLELGEEGLAEQDLFLLEINLGDLETSSGEDQHYWLLQIEAARRDYALRMEAQHGANAGTAGDDRA